MTETTSSSAKLSKKALDDLELTKHRLAKLKLEEARIQGQISLADRRAEEFRRRRQITVEQHREQQERKQEIEKQQEEIRRLVSSSRQQRQESMESARKRMMAERRAAAEAVQRERRIHECERNVILEEERDKILSRRENIRDLEKTLKERRDRSATNRLQSVKEQLKQEIEYDKQEREESQRRARWLKSEEEQLRDRINMLKNRKTESRKQLQSLYHIEPPPSAQGQRADGASRSESESNRTPQRHRVDEEA